MLTTVLRTSFAFVAAIVLIHAPTANAQSHRRAREEHITIRAIRSGLSAWMTPEEGAPLEAIDASNTGRGSTRTLTLLAADRVVRVVLPLALEGAGREADAARLRALSPVVDRATARQARAVIAEMPALGEPPRNSADMTGPLGCELPLTWAQLILQMAGDSRFGDRGDVPVAFCAASRTGADRRALVEAAVTLVRDLVAAAQRDAVANATPRTRESRRVAR